MTDKIAATRKGVCGLLHDVRMRNLSVELCTCSQSPPLIQHHEKKQQHVSFGEIISSEHKSPACKDLFLRESPITAAWADTAGAFPAFRSVFAIVNQLKSYFLCIFKLCVCGSVNVLQTKQIRAGSRRTNMTWTLFPLLLRGYFMNSYRHIY